MAKHKTFTATLSEIVDLINDNDDRECSWDEMMGVEIPGLDKARDRYWNVLFNKDATREDEEEAFDMIRHLYSDFLVKHGHELWSVNWPDHVDEACFDQEALYHKV